MFPNALQLNLLNALMDYVFKMPFNARHHRMEYKVSCIASKCLLFTALIFLYLAVMARAEAQWTSASRCTRALQIVRWMKQWDATMVLAPGKQVIAHKPLRNAPLLSRICAHQVNVPLKLLTASVFSPMDAPWLPRTTVTKPVAAWKIALPASAHTTYSNEWTKTLLKHTTSVLNRVKSLASLKTWCTVLPLLPNAIRFTMAVQLPHL